MGYFGETNHASLNDLINTTLGGIALGEMFHRAAWLVRDTHATGRGRMWKEIGATALDPITGVNRFITATLARRRQASRHGAVELCEPRASAGVLWRGIERRRVQTRAGSRSSRWTPCTAIRSAGRSRTPYDAFGVRLRFGGGSAFSEARVRGRLLGQPLGEREPAVQRRPDLRLPDQRRVPHRRAVVRGRAGVSTSATLADTSLWVLGWGGLTVLGAVDSLPLDSGLIPRPPAEEKDPSAGQGVSEGPRYYDYGPGSNFGVTGTALPRCATTSSCGSYEGRQIYSLDGVRANHLLQRVRVDLMVPVRGAFGLGVSGEYFDRRTFYQNADAHKGSLSLSADSCLFHLESLVTRLARDLARVVVAVACLAPVAAAAQTAPPPATTDDVAEGASRLWLVAGGAFSTFAVTARRAKKTTRTGTRAACSRTSGTG